MDKYGVRRLGVESTLNVAAKKLVSMYHVLINVYRFAHVFTWLIVR